MRDDGPRGGPQLDPAPHLRIGFTAGRVRWIVPMSASAAWTHRFEPNA